MNTEYLLDTSAIRAASKSLLESAASVVAVAASPFSVYEILCHLDEPSAKHGDQWFAYRKGQVLKCQWLAMREDPFAEQAEAVGARRVVSATRFDDRSLLPKIFPLLEESKTLDEFYRKTVEYPNGERGSTKNAASNARRLLERYEATYLDMNNRIHEGLLRESTFTDALALSSVERVRYVRDNAVRLSNFYRENGAHVDVASVFNALYLHFAYTLSRTLEYMRRAGDGKPLTIDRNDAEDASILLHLDLSKPIVLVTNDGVGRRHGTVDAFREAISHLHAAAEELGGDVTALTGVMSLDDFKKVVAASTTPSA